MSRSLKRKLSQKLNCCRFSCILNRIICSLIEVEKLLGIK